MSNYTKQISWSGKDALSDSDPEKVISGGDFDTEFSAVQTAINSKIDTGGVVASDIASNAITEAKIADNAITEAKIADNAITEAKIADNAITLAKMAHGTDGEIITYDSSGAPATVGVGTSGQVLTSNGAGSAPTMQDAGGGSLSTYYRITDSTDVTIAATAAGANTIGSSFSINIPTSGSIAVTHDDYTFTSTGAAGRNDIQFGLKINSTVYRFSYWGEGVIKYGGSPTHQYLNTGKTNVRTISSTGNNPRASIDSMIVNESLPTGSQTTELVVFDYQATGGAVLKGTTMVMNFVVEVIDTSGV